MAKIQGLIFDFDGLLVDTETARFTVWDEVFRSFGLEISYEFIESIFGVEAEVNPVIPHLESLLGKKVDAAKIEQRVKDRFFEIINAKDLQPGALDYLLKAKEIGLAMAIASNAKRSQILPIIKRVGIEEYFQAILTIDDVENPKPHPEMLNLALKELNLTSDQAVMFDDSPVGVKAARAANIFCVSIPNDLTKHFHFDVVDLHLDSMEDMSLQDLLELIEART